jgi:hypothetical protein
VVLKYPFAQVKITEADEQVAAPVPVHATQVPTETKYPLEQVIGIGPVVQAVAFAGHANTYPFIKLYPDAAVAA